ncbi:hypothetical protein HMPREF1986_00760 [Oribacterium sp. oral taxon 078 str. F0263]|nr:hypothetical protein HMPREF1986_00760 [Oribacterium sp. oral taxon 078 str. F0263]
MSGPGFKRRENERPAARMMRLRSAGGQSPGGKDASDIAGGETITWRYRRLGYSRREGGGIARGRFSQQCRRKERKAKLHFPAFCVTIKLSSGRGAIPHWR